MPRGQSLLYHLLRLLLLLSLLLMTYWLQQWFPMTIMCSGLKSLTKNLGMILQATAHLQHLLFLLHMTLLLLHLSLLHHGDATGENWEDSSCDSLPADRFWNIASECNIAADDEGPCMGIELNIWECAKTNIVVIIIISIIEVVDII